MLLQSIQIKNYRSIEDITFEIKALDDSSYTFGLIGVNEAGKSSILKAMALKDSIVALTPKDFKEKNKNVEVLFKYKLDVNDNFEVYNKIVAGESPPTASGSAAIQPDDVVGFKLSFSIASPIVPIYEFLYSKKKYDLAISVTVPKEFFERMHYTVFWEAKSEYLISGAINLDIFSASPEISIPLKNSFRLAGIERSGIPMSIANITSDTTEKKHLEGRLSRAVTNHISKVWPGHPIKIIFDIDGRVITFQVMDTNAEEGKAKTADQRSDGFRQFISFLLTVSAEDSNEELNNCLLLLDEPETHLHPQAQIYFLDELKKITTNDRGNIVLFATHSNYMIDKDKLIRNFKVTKETENTSIEPIDTKDSTYASVNYEVFGIATSDYHSELYGKLHEKFKIANPTNDKKEKICEFDKEFFHGTQKQSRDKPSWGKPNQATLPTFVRNCIHHSDNGNVYTQAELIKSIELMKKLVV